MWYVCVQVHQNSMLSFSEMYALAEQRLWLAILACNIANENEVERWL